MVLRGDVGGWTTLGGRVRDEGRFSSMQRLREVSVKLSDSHGGHRGMLVACGIPLCWAGTCVYAG